MSRQTFNTVDVARLEVEDNPTGVVNLVENPDGELGGYGWITPVAGSYMKGGDRLTYWTGGGGDYFYTEPLSLLNGPYAAASWTSPVSDNGVDKYEARFEWLNASYELVAGSGSPITPNVSGSLVNLAPVQAPVGAVYARLRFTPLMGDNSVPAWGQSMALEDVTVASSTAASDLQVQYGNFMPDPSFDVVGGIAAEWTIESSNTAFTQRSSASTGFFGRIAPTASLTQASVRLTDPIPVTPEQQYTFSGLFSGGTAVSMRLEAVYYVSGGWYVKDIEVLFEGAPAGFSNRQHWTFTVPAQEAGQSPIDSFRLRVKLYRTDGTSLWRTSSDYNFLELDLLSLEEGATNGAYAADAEFVLPFIEPVVYADILGPSHEINIAREALNVGTLTASILDAALDPSTGSLIRPGRRVRLMVAHGSEETPGYRPLFTGRIQTASVTYELKRPEVPTSKRARIELTAADNIAVLANQVRSEGVAEIGDLGYVLEGAGVPWNVNGSSSQIAAPVIAAFNDNASAIDQVAVTRDSALGYAWVDRHGVLQARDADQMPTTYMPLGPADYVDIDKSFSTDDCINSVVIKYLRFNPTTQETEEVTYGPYRDQASIAEWGEKSQEFTVQGIAEETTDLEAYAQKILTANAQPMIRTNSFVLPVKDFAGVERAGNANLDLYGGVSVTGPNAGDVPEQLRVTKLEHAISTNKWLSTYWLSEPSTVATPSAVPAPSTGGAGLTVGQLLRPVGEVTMFGGAVPAGWLELNGGTFDAAAYPRLAEYLGGNTLPDMTDRFPIGAGSKAVGTSGGSPTKVIGAANLPPHAHSITHSHSIATTSAATGSATARVARGTTTNSGDLANPVKGTDTPDSGAGPGLSEPLDVLNPWRAVRFAIRAV